MENKITLTLSQDEYNTLTDIFFNAETEIERKIDLFSIIKELYDRENMNLGKLYTLQRKITKQKREQEEKPQEVKQ